MKFTDYIRDKYGFDKICHFLCGGWIVSMLSPFGWIGVLIGVVIMLGLSFVKEKFFDDFFDKNDIYAACLGGGVSVIAYLILTLLI